MTVVYTLFGLLLAYNFIEWAIHYPEKRRASKLAKANRDALRGHLRHLGIDPESPTWYQELETARYHREVGRKASEENEKLRMSQCTGTELQDFLALIKSYQK